MSSLVSVQPPITPTAVSALIARLVKDTRDKHLIEKDARGRTINALTALGVIGGCTDTNEVNYLLVKAFRAGLGVVPIEQQARI